MRGDEAVDMMAPRTLWPVPVVSLWLLLALPCVGLAQTFDPPARGGVGVITSEVGVDRDPVDDRSTCAARRLLGQRPQVGVTRDPVGAPRTPTLGAPPPGPTRTSDPCSDEASTPDDGVTGAVVAMMSAISSRLFQAVQAIVPGGG